MATKLFKERHCWRKYPTTIPNYKWFPRRIVAIFIITVYLTASAKAVPDACFHSPTSSSRLSSLIKTFSVVTSEFRRHHDLLHQSVLSILSVWSISVVYQTPYLCSGGFFNRSDKSSDTAFRDQSQPMIQLYAAFQMCFTQRFDTCQGDPISFDCALVHQRVRDCADEVHVDSEAEAKALILCIVSIKRWRLAQASQVLEQFGIKKFRHFRSSVASS